MMRFLLLALLLLSAASFGGTKVTPNVGTNMSILNSSNTGYLSGTNYWKQGDTVTSYMERLGRHTPIGVTPSRGVPTSRIASAAKDLLRFSPTAIASSIGLMAVVESAGWAIDELVGQLSRPDTINLTDPTYGLWSMSNDSFPGPSPSYVCKAYVESIFGSGWPSSVVVQGSSTSQCYQKGNHFGTMKRIASCPTDYSLDSATGTCLKFNGHIPVTSAEIDALALSGDASFYDGIMRDSCNLSVSPERCFDSLSPEKKLEGPSTVSGSKTTTTSTQTNADGSTTTVQKETQTDFDIAYGDDHFVYTPKTTTETKVDGQTTETTTEQEDTGADSEQKPEEEAVSEIAGLQCEAAVSCSGDAIQCAIAKTQKDTKCILQDAFDYSSQKSDVETVFQGDDYVIEDEEIDIPSFIGQGARFLPATCPAPIPMSLSGKTYSLDTQPFCTFATDLSFLIVAFATLAAALYIGRAFGGE